MGYKFRHDLLSLVLGLILLSLGRTAFADVVTLNFDSVNTSNGGGGYVKVDPTAYFATFGVTFVNNNPFNGSNIDNPSNPGSHVAIINYNDVYGGLALAPVSGPNLLEQYDSHLPVSFSLIFATPLDSFGFTIPGDLAPSLYPAWNATAYNGTTALSSFGAGLNCCHGPLVYTLNGPDITSVTISSNNEFVAGFGGVPLDNMVLTTPVPEPETYALMLAGLGLLGFAARRRKLKEAAA